MEVTHSVEWAAGIIEGEGSFRFHKFKNRKNSYSVGIQVSMIDEDTLNKLFDVLKVGAVRGPYFNKAKSPMWTWAVYKQTDVFDLLIKIGPYLSKRRVQQATPLFNYLEDRLCK